jgi:hypothetical protein
MLNDDRWHLFLFLEDESLKEDIEASHEGFITSSRPLHQAHGRKKAIAN